VWTGAQGAAACAAAVVHFAAPTQPRACRSGAVSTRPQPVRRARARIRAEPPRQARRSPLLLGWAAAGASSLCARARVLARLALRRRRRDRAATFRDPVTARRARAACLLHAAARPAQARRPRARASWSAGPSAAARTRAPMRGTRARRPASPSAARAARDERGAVDRRESRGMWTAQARARRLATARARRLARTAGSRK
jgi:hypothetical protein